MKFLSTFHAEYRDDDSIKEVLLHVTGFETHFDRHVLLQRLNSMKDDAPVTQIVQLTGQAGNYDYYAPVVTCTDTTIRKKIIPVGTLPRTQRDRRLVPANQFKFRKISTTNNCRVWLR